LIFQSDTLNYLYG
ncbi:bacterial type II/III secretion system short domain protein, partial [Escherichia coli 89.0511]